ncbi:NusG domain II-containing protein [uncultured Eubacterium sp.]|uniref:NusG domain II-containing protein n=1 Tax=uncultured Eubacterium sp. TaxID=165185 RepID=UPI00326309BA
MKLKKYDIIAIICVAVIVIICYITVNLLRNGEADTVVIYVDGKIEKKLDLNKNQEYKVNVDNGYNIIRIKDKKVRIKESDCSNQTCVNMGTISKDGQTLICLPHKVEVTIVSDDKSEVDVIAR